MVNKKKTTRELHNTDAKSRKRVYQSNQDENAEESQCENEFEDEFQDESSVTENDDDSIIKASDSGYDTDINHTCSPQGHNHDKKQKTRIPFLPGTHQLAPGEILEHDPRMYRMLHSATTEWSCLSLDVMADSLGNNRTKYPHTCFVVAGTQAEKHRDNRIFIMRWSRLHRTDRTDTDDLSSSSGKTEIQDDDSDDDYYDEDPIIDISPIFHDGTVNRIVSCKLLRRLVATWSDSGHVHIFDVERHISAVENPGSVAKLHVEPLFTFDRHQSDGFAIEWSPHSAGVLISGDGNGQIWLHQPHDGIWKPTDTPIAICDASCEDLHWKILGSDATNIFIAGSADRSIRTIDIRSNATDTITIKEAHDCDVNSVRWNPLQEHMFLSGDDNGCIKAWDLRYTDQPVAHIAWHKKPITSLGWHPTDSAIFAAACLDNSISLWDLSVEPDDSNLSLNLDHNKFPDQLIFLHLGQDHIAELKWHPQIPGVILSTAADSFNIFRTCNI